MLLDADELLALPFLGPRVARSAASTPVERICVLTPLQVEAFTFEPLEGQALGEAGRRGQR